MSTIITLMKINAVDLFYTWNFEGCSKIDMVEFVVIILFNSALTTIIMLKAYAINN